MLSTRYTSQSRYGSVIIPILVIFCLGSVAWSLTNPPQEQKRDHGVDRPSNQGSNGERKRQGISNPVIPSKPERIDDAQLYMQAKLACSQKVLEGLVTEDFTLIGNGAKQMKRISEAAHWPKTVDEVYQHYSVSFRKQCDKLAEQAERRDLQAAHYTYLHISTTCIDCHNYVRGRFRVERQGQRGPVRLIPTHWDGPVKKQPQPPQPDNHDNHDNQDTSWTGEMDR